MDETTTEKPKPKRKRSSSAKRSKRTAHLRQTDLSLETGLQNAIVRMGKNLRQRREKLQLSQKQVGESVGMHQATLGQMERGQYAPGFGTLLKLSHALKMRPAELFHGVRL